MFPRNWIINWAPQIHFPFGGSVAQNYQPKTSWFSDLISPKSGNARIEQKAFELASYGTQLGLISDVLLGLAGDDSRLSGRPRESLETLRALSSEIDAIKAAERKDTAAQIVAMVSAMRERGGSDYEQLRALLSPLLDDAGRPQAKRAAGK